LINPVITFAEEVRGVLFQIIGRFTLDNIIVVAFVEHGKNEWNLTWI